MPFREEKPEEILTIANRLLGSGQTSLAKFLIIAAQETGLKLSTHDYPAFFKHFLERVDWKRDLHFHTRTTIDTLDYSGTSWNEGSKLVMACRGPAIRSLNKNISSNSRFPNGLDRATFLTEGILCLRAEGFQDYTVEPTKIHEWCSALKNMEWPGIPLIVLCDDPEFTAANWNNFLWVTFTRANPSHDIYGVDEFLEFKHWGCRGPLVIDARKKPHHAPELIADPEVTKRADRFFASGGPLAKFG
jgi:4-hydroxy-3-polyprenylbenzoate decarboxylase